MCDECRTDSLNSIHHCSREEVYGDSQKVGNCFARAVCFFVVCKLLLFYWMKTERLVLHYFSVSFIGQVRCTVYVRTYTLRYNVAASVLSCMVWLHFSPIERGEMHLFDRLFLVNGSRKNPQKSVRPRRVSGHACFSKSQTNFSKCLYAKKIAD